MKSSRKHVFLECWQTCTHFPIGQKKRVEWVNGPPHTPFNAQNEFLFFFFFGKKKNKSTGNVWESFLKNFF
jgi:hypothetical protein